MRVAWVHPTWRDLVIERLAADAELRRRFLRRCGPHGVALALSTLGGAEGARQLPLLSCDDDWDALGDRIFILAPALEPRETVIVLTAVDHLLQAVADDARRAGEAAALARMSAERFGEVWTDAHTTIALPCIDAWLSVAGQLTPSPWPTFLAVTWADLLPTAVPALDDLPEMQRFADWQTLCQVVATFSADLLDELGYGAPQRSLMRAFREREDAARARVQRTGRSPVPEPFIEHARAQRIADDVIRRVLVDL